jgi:hypothetical protein
MIRFSAFFFNCSGLHEEARECVETLEKSESSEDPLLSVFFTFFFDNGFFFGEEANGGDLGILGVCSAS